MMSTVLSIDLGTKTGWALRNKDNQITSGTVNLLPKKSKVEGTRFANFRSLLDKLLSIVGNIDAVYFERVYRHLGTSAAHVYGAFWGQLTGWCAYHKINCEGIAVQKIKFFITGKGNADKNAVIAAVKALGHAPTDDNEADAIALLHYATRKHDRGKND